MLRRLSSLADNAQYNVLSGEVKTWQRQGESGKSVTNGYCANCCTLMWVQAEAMPDVRIFKPGTLDDKAVLDKLSVGQEIFVRNRPDCIAAFEGVTQKDGQ